MNVLLPKLLRQALAQRAEPKLARRERARGRVASDGCGRAGEHERAALALLVEFVLLEREDSTARERERCADIRVKRLRDLRVRDLQERLPHAVPCVPHRRAQSPVRPVRADRGERGRERVGGVRGHGERSGLASRRCDRRGGVLEVVGVARDERDAVACFGEDASESQP